MISIRSIRTTFAGVALALLVAVIPVLVATPAPAAQSGLAGAWAQRLTGYFAVADGTKLKYSVLLPPGDGPFPVLVNYNGYDAGSIGGSPYKSGSTGMSADLDASLLEAGYAVLGVNIRGTGCSGGKFELFGPAWGPDGAEAVEWAARQPWSTGRVGMVDWSWGGLSQLMVAEERPAHLKAIAPGMVVTDPVRDVGMPGGVPNVGFPLVWWTYIQGTWTYAERTAVEDGDLTCLTNVAANLAAGQLASPPVLQVQHPYEDDYARSHQSLSRIGRIQVPVLSVEAWQDGSTGPRGGYYQERLNPERTWLIGTNGGHDLYMSTALRSQLIDYFDHFLKGKANGWRSRPHVQLWQETHVAGEDTSAFGPLEERRRGSREAAPSWLIRRQNLPLAVRPLELNLRSGGRLTAGLPGSDERSAAAARLPLGPAVGFLGQLDGWTQSSPPSNARSFTTAPLPQSLTFTGSASANLWVSSTTSDADLQVTVTEVRPDGQEVYVQRGWLRLSSRALDPTRSRALRPVHLLTRAARAPLTPGVPVRARLEINKFTHTFRPGSAIRIWIDTPSPTGDWAFNLNLNQGAVRILHDRAHRSSVVFGYLPGVSRPPAALGCGSVLGQPCRVTSRAVPTGTGPRPPVQ